MVEQVKLKSWLWISATKSQMLYPVSCWFNNPRGCLGLSGGVELVWFRFAVGGKVPLLCAWLLGQYKALR